MELLKNKNLIVSNKLIKGRYQLTRDEQNFIYLLISQINQDDNKFTEYQIHIKDLEGEELTQKNYPRYRKFARKLRSREIIIEDEEKILVSGWFADIEYMKNTGYIKATISEKLKPYLLELKEEFTQAKLPTLLNFNSKYSSRLYLLLKSDFDRQKKYKSNLYVNYDIEYLNRKFELPKSYFIRYSAFKEKFLLKSLKEINKKTDLQISYQELKTGRKITSIQFCISKPEECLGKAFEYLEESKTKEDYIPQDLSNKAREVLLDGELALTISDLKKIFDHYRIEDIENICEELWNIWDNKKLISHQAFLRGKLKYLNKNILFGFDELLDTEDK